MTTFHCPHCGAELSHVERREAVPVESAQTYRRRMTPTLRSQIAEIVASETDPAAVISERFAVGRRQANRYIADANRSA